MTAADTGWTRRYGLPRLIWLTYLLIYPLPWLEDHPSPHDIWMSAAGVAVFLPIYLRVPEDKPMPLYPAVVFAAIGYVLAPYHGAWTVFATYAVSAAARIVPRRKALVVIALLLASIPAFTALTHRPPIDAGFGVLLGVLIAMAMFSRISLLERNKQLLAAQTEVRGLAATAERERIARDLHDLLGHSLTMIAIKADLAGRMMARDPARTAAEIEEIGTAARTALREVRAAVTGMKGASLAYELDRARAALTSAGVALHVVGETAPIAPARDGVLAMALREAVTNVIRHAQATACTIILTHENGEIAEMIVQDNGMTRAAPREGNGLLGMRARLTAAGGSLEVHALRPGLRITARLAPS